ncbi:DUF1127 domain-containing protein [Rhodobacterales bacterium HKCCE2091]|nr:DUF1127 domain-containing protein [Rhodobacterales bacterium HKCCE2091]
MTYATSIPSVPAASRVGFGRLVAAWRAYVEWRGYRRTVRALRPLDAHIMRDIGLEPISAPPRIDIAVRGNPW